MDVLVHIKRLIIGRHFQFSLKALDELDADGLEPQDALEAVLNARSIKKVLRSPRPGHPGKAERLYVIEGIDYSGRTLYTKGKIVRRAGEEVFYFYISAKVS